MIKDILEILNILLIVLWILYAVLWIIKGFAKRKLPTKSFYIWTLIICFLLLALGILGLVLSFTISSLLNVIGWVMICIANVLVFKKFLKS